MVQKDEQTDKPSEEELTTRVDDLLDLLKKQEKIPMEQAAQELGVSLDVIQSWVDFLVEEQIVGIEYKFTKPYIYLNQPDEQEEKAKQQVEQEKEKKSYEDLKKDFMEKAQQKNIPKENLGYLWKNHVTKALESKKDFFEEEASKRGFEDIEKLWEKYKQRFIRQQTGEAQDGA